MMRPVILRSRPTVNRLPYNIDKILDDLIASIAVVISVAEKRDEEKRCQEPFTYTDYAQLTYSSADQPGLSS